MPAIRRGTAPAARPIATSHEAGAPRSGAAAIPVKGKADSRGAGLSDARGSLRGREIDQLAEQVLQALPILGGLGLEGDPEAPRAGGGAKLDAGHATAAINVDDLV